MRWRTGDSGGNRISNGRLHAALSLRKYGLEHRDIRLGEKGADIRLEGNGRFYPHQPQP